MAKIRISFKVAKAMNIEFNEHNYPDMYIDNAINYEIKNRLENVSMMLEEIQDKDIVFYNIEVIDG